jgi:hypothetical protein
LIRSKLSGAIRIALMLLGQNRLLGTIEPGRAPGWRSLDRRDAAFELGSALFASSTRYAGARRSRLGGELASCILHVSKPSLNAPIVSTRSEAHGDFRILHDDLSPPVDRQDQRVPVFFSRSISSEVLRLRSLSERMSLVSAWVLTRLHRVMIHAVDDSVNTAAALSGRTGQVCRFRPRNSVVPCRSTASREPRLRESLSKSRNSVHYESGTCARRVNLTFAS